jgi:hypothetical protein
MKLTEGGKLERPNICTICERTPEVGTKVVDTERYFEGWPYVLQGRRYVCEKCIKEMLKFFDFADRNEVLIAQTAQLRAEAVVRGVKLKVDSMTKELRTLAEDPSVFMVEEPSAEVAAIGGVVREVAVATPDAESSGVGESKAEPSGSADSGAKRGSGQGSRAQSRPRKPANTTA